MTLTDHVHSFILTIAFFIADIKKSFFMNIINKIFIKFLAAILKANSNQSLKIGLEVKILKVVVLNRKKPRIKRQWNFYSFVIYCWGNARNTSKAMPINNYFILINFSALRKVEFPSTKVRLKNFINQTFNFFYPLL